MAVSNGNPTLSVVLNNSGGPGGSFDVTSGGSTYFSVSETGVVTVSEKITRHSATRQRASREYGRCAPTRSMEPIAM